MLNAPNDKHTNTSKMGSPQPLGRRCNARLALWICVNAIIFVAYYFNYVLQLKHRYLYKTLNIGLCLSRAAAMVINFNLLLVWLPMCKYTLTRAACAANALLRGPHEEAPKKSHHFAGAICIDAPALHAAPAQSEATKTSRVARAYREAARKMRAAMLALKVHCVSVFLVAVDHCNSLHTICATTITIASAHLMNVINFSRNYDPLLTNLNMAEFRGQNPLQLLVSVPGITGLLMLIILALMSLSSVDIIRNSSYDLFQVFHRLSIIFVVLLFLHPSSHVLKEQSNLDRHHPDFCYTKLVELTHNDSLADAMRANAQSLEEPLSVAHPTVARTNTTQRAWISYADSYIHNQNLPKSQIESTTNSQSQSPTTDLNATIVELTSATSVQTIKATLVPQNSSEPLIARTAESHERSSGQATTYTSAPNTQDQFSSSYLEATTEPAPTTTTQQPILSKIKLTHAKRDIQGVNYMSSDTAHDENVESTHQESLASNHDWSRLCIDRLPVFVAQSSICWYVLSIGLSCYLVDMILRKMRRNKSSIELLEFSCDSEGNLLELILSSNHRRFHRWLPGQFVYLNCPQIAAYEWHPFTISSMDESSKQFSLHIKTSGDWTRKLRHKLDEMRANLRESDCGALNKKPSREFDFDRIKVQQRCDSSVSINLAGLEHDVGELKGRSFSWNVQATSKSTNSHNKMLVSVQCKRVERILPIQDTTSETHQQPLAQCSCAQSECKSTQEPSGHNECDECDSEHKQYPQDATTMASYKLAASCQKNSSHCANADMSSKTIEVTLTPDVKAAAELRSSATRHKSGGQCGWCDAARFRWRANGLAVEQSALDCADRRAVRLNLYIDGPFHSPFERLLEQQVSVCIANGVGWTAFSSVFQYITNNILHATRQQRSRAQWQWQRHRDDDYTKVCKVDTAGCEGSKSKAIKFTNACEPSASQQCRSLHVDNEHDLSSGSRRHLDSAHTRNNSKRNEWWTQWCQYANSNACRSDTMQPKNLSDTKLHLIIIVTSLEQLKPFYDLACNYFDIIRSECQMSADDKFNPIKEITAFITRSSKDDSCVKEFCRTEKLGHILSDAALPLIRVNEIFSIIFQRPTFDTYLSRFSDVYPNSRKISVFCCGSQQVKQTVQDICRSLNSQNLIGKRADKTPGSRKKPKFSYHEENF